MQNDIFVDSSSFKLLQKFFDYRFVNDILWIHHRDFYLSCVSKIFFLIVFKNAHDKNDYWVKIDIITRLRNKCYWSEQFQNVKKYVVECLKCAKHESIIKSQSLNSVLVFFSFQFCEMNFINSLKITIVDHKFILLIICYFNRFVVSFACKSTNVENVFWYLKLFFAMYRKSLIFYNDSSQHFFNDVFKDFLREENIAIDYNSFDSSKNTNMIEIFNKLLKKMLRKNNTDKNWNLRLIDDEKTMNDRLIEYLDVNSTDINFDQIFEISAIISMFLKLSKRCIKKWYNELINSITHATIVRNYLRYKVELHDTIRKTTKRRKKQNAINYNKNVKQIIHKSENFVLLYQKNTSKLKSRWRDFFQIFEYENNHDLFFTLNQLNDKRIKNNFHKNHLKQFISRIDYLIVDEIMNNIDTIFQTIRKFRRRRIFVWSIS